MSGVGEVLAIVSCVAGLIQAYDAGSRIVVQMKRRRQAHGALPPSDLLEESIDKGKQEIQKVVEDGRKRFGPSFEEGDTTAQLALYKITIETQKALLEGLTEARDDDGIIDFEDCINASDWSRTKALVELNALFSRKLDEEMERRKIAPKPQPIPVQQPPPASPGVQTGKVASIKTRSSPQVPSQRAAAPLPPPAPPPVKRSKTFGVFGRRSSAEKEPKPPKPEKVELPRNPPKYAELPGPSGRLSTFVGPEMTLLAGRPSRTNTSTNTNTNANIHRRDTTASIGSDSTRSSNEKRDSIYSDSSSLRSPTRTNTTASIVPFSRQSTAVSLTPTLASGIQYGGSCKYASYLRDGKFEKGMMLGNANTFSNNMIYTCRSSKCRFRGPAVQTKSGWSVSDKVYKLSGVGFRWLFLAKSHVQVLELTPASAQPYCCLICTLLGDESQIYNGHDALMAHVAGHQGAYLGDSQLDGPLSFQNSGTSREDNYDLVFPEEAAPSPPPGEQSYDNSVAVLMATNIRHTDDGLTMLKTDTFLDEYNPWAS